MLRNEIKIVHPASTSYETYPDDARLAIEAFSHIQHQQIS